MPAFGKNGMFNLNQSAPKKMWAIVKPDGTAVMSCNDREQLESHLKNLSEKLGCELTVVEKTAALI